MAINGVEFTGQYMRVQVIAATEEEAREEARDHVGIMDIEWSEVFNEADDLWEVTFQRYAAHDC